MSISLGSLLLLGEKPVFNIQFKLPLTQFQAILLGPVIHHHREEISVRPYSSPYKEVGVIHITEPVVFLSLTGAF